jgi:hypothetical protein
MDENIVGLLGVSKELHFMREYPTYTPLGELKSSNTPLLFAILIQFNYIIISVFQMII